MGSAISAVKALQQSWSPLYLWQITTKDDAVHYWSSQAVTFDGNAYESLVLDHSSPSVDAGLWGFEAVTQVSLVVNNADGSLNSVITPTNWGGALLVGRFVFYNPATGACTTDSKCFGTFRCDLPNGIWPRVEFSAHNLLNFARKVIPLSVITRKDRYPFPSTAVERAAAGSDPTSEFYPIGYDPDNAKGLYRGGATQLITNRKFDTTDDWTVYGTGVAISGGKLNFTASPFGGVQQNVGLVPSTTYTVTFTVSGYVSGQVCIEHFGATYHILTLRSANGTYTEVFESAADANGYIGIYSDDNTTLSVDNVSLCEGDDPYYVQSDYNGTRDVEGTDGTVSLETIGLSARFGGFGRIPATITYTPKKGEHEEFKGSANEGKTGQAVPLIYGTCRIQPIVLDTGGPAEWNGSRLSHLLLCDGVNFAPTEAGYGIDSVLDVILPGAKDGKDYRGLIPPTSSGETAVFGSWNYDTGKLTTLYRNIVPATDLEAYDPQDRDLYSGLAYLIIGYPKEMAMQSSEAGPKTEVIVKGLKVETWDHAQTSTWQWSDNPVWVFIDILKRMGYPIAQIDKDIAYHSADYCAVGGVGGTQLFGCNLALMGQVKVSDVLRGIRANARIYCTYGSDGKLQIRIKKTFTEEGSSFAITTANLVRENSGQIQCKKWHKSYLETANVFTCNFQDPAADYQAATLTKLASDNIADLGERISADSILAILGASSYDHAERALNTAKSEYVDCNEYYTVRTTLALIENQVGQVGTITETRNGLSSQQCRIIKMDPQRDGTIEIILQKHQDATYSNTIITAPMQRILNDLSYTPRSVGELSLTEYLYTTEQSRMDRFIHAEFPVPPTAYDSSFTSATKIENIVVSTTGGTILGAYYDLGQDFYIEVCPTKGAGQGLPSVGGQWVHIPTTTDTNKFSFDLTLPAEADGYTLRIGAWCNAQNATYHVIPVPGRCYKHSTVVTALKSLTVEVTDISTLDDTSLSPDPSYDHAVVLYAYGNTLSFTNLKYGGRTASPTDAAITFAPEPAPPDAENIYVIVISSNSSESDFYPWSLAPTAELALSTYQAGNPSGCSGLQILITNDDPSIAGTDMVFQFNRDLYNWQTIFAVEVTLRSFTQWVAATVRTLGDVICNYAGTMTFRCTQAGTSHATTEPTWSTGMGSETTDGTAKWRRIIPPAAHGPYAYQRATWPADVLASGSGVTSTAGEVTITLNMPTPPADNTYQDKVLLLFLSTLVTEKWEPETAYGIGDRIVDTNNKIQRCTDAGTSDVAEPTWATGVDDVTGDNDILWTNEGSADTGLDGNIITSQIGNLVTIYSTERFVRTATMNWAIVEQWWIPGVNAWEQTYLVPEAIKGGKLADKVWRTEPRPKLDGKVVAADVWPRNIFGVSQ